MPPPVVKVDVSHFCLQNNWIIVVSGDGSPPSPAKKKILCLNEVGFWGDIIYHIANICYGADQPELIGASRD